MRFAILIFSIVFVMMCFPARAQMIPWWNIEPERVRPQAKIELPHIQTVPDAVDFFFEPDPLWAADLKETYPVVHMRVPKAPYFEKKASSGPFRQYEISIRMFYPNFSGLADPENFECHMQEMKKAGKAGHCRRQLDVMFGFAFMPSRSEELARKNLEDAIARGSIINPNQKSKYPGLELVVKDKNENFGSTYYISYDDKGKAEFVIHCDEFVPSPACNTMFRSKKSPYVYIDLDFVLELLPQWKSLIEDTRNKVDSMIIDTYQLPIKG